MSDIVERAEKWLEINTRSVHPDSNILEGSCRELIAEVKALREEKEELLAALRIGSLGKLFQR